MIRQRLRAPGYCFEQLARVCTIWAGSSRAFALAVGVIVIWAITGPLFNFSDSWQLVINTGTTIVTFLMVFLIQQAQNKESLAVQVKLNEIIAVLHGASNRLINIEDQTEAEVRELHDRYQKLAEQILHEEEDACRSHSIEEASPADVIVQS